MDVVSVHTELSSDDKRVKSYMAAEEPEKKGGKLGWL